MTPFNTDRYSEPECAAAFQRLFPHGFSGPDVLAEIASESWAQSPLVAVFHPSVEQVFDESVRMHRNIENLWKDRPGRQQAPEPTLEEIRASFRETAIELRREVDELVGKCLWDIFSDNHDVLGPDGRMIDIGSFRGAGGFIADELNRQVGESRYDYMDFYMGTIWIDQRADLTPVYRMIFGRLRATGLDWVYQFPKLHLIDFRPLREALDAENKPEWMKYSPEAAFAKEQEDAERDRQLAEMRERMEEDHRRAVEEAQSGPPPKTVVAYQAVYGQLPRGWPPEV